MTAQSASGRLVTVLGGSGFVGRYVVRQLAQRGYRVRVGVRRPDLAGHLQPLGAVGQIHAVQANIRVPYSVEAAVSGASAVVNLVGILHESGRQRFDIVQGRAAGVVAQAARQADAEILVHVSAIGADADSESAYARSKAEGEAEVREAFPGSVIMRPSVVFGPEDDFFNRFAAMARFSPALPLIGGGQTRFQPIFVGDVARAVAQAVDGKAKAGTTYELGGAQVRTFEELMRLMLSIIERQRFLVPVPWPVARVMGSALGLLPNPLLTRDQVILLERDNVVSAQAQADGRTLCGLGVNAQTLEAILPGYLKRFRRTGEYNVRATS